MAYTLIQKATMAAEQFTQMTITMGQNFGAGHGIVVAVYSPLSEGLIPVGSTDTFQLAVNTLGTTAIADSRWGAVYYCTSSVGGYDSISVTTGYNVWMYVYVYEFSDVVYLDQSQFNLAFSQSADLTTYTTTATGTTTNATEAVVGIGVVLSDTGSSTISGPVSTWTNSTAYTDKLDGGGSYYSSTVSGYILSSSKAAFTYNGSCDTGGGATTLNYAGGCIATFETSITVSLGACTVNVGVNAVLGLIASMAPNAGQDNLGNKYASGFTGLITSFQPDVVPTAPETWHNIVPPGGWNGTLRYKLLAESNFGVIDMNLTAATGTAGTIALGTIPVVYAPLFNLYRPLVAGTAGTDRAADLYIGTNGSLVAENFTTTSTIATMSTTAYYPLDL